MKSRSLAMGLMVGLSALTYTPDTNAAPIKNYSIPVKNPVKKHEFCGSFFGMAKKYGSHGIKELYSLRIKFQKPPFTPKGLEKKFDFKPSPGHLEPQNPGLTEKVHDYTSFNPDQVPSTPEPWTLALFGLGLSSLGFFARRK